MILDHRGNPIAPQNLKKEQAVQTWTRSYAMLAPQTAQTPERISAVLRQAASGDMYAQSLLFADMEEKDTHIFAEMQKRKGALSGLPWNVQPWDDSAPQQEMAEAVTSILNALSPSDLFFSMADGFGKGLSAIEMTWDMANGHIAPVRAIQRPLGWFQWQSENILPIDEIGLANMTLNAEPLIPGKWLVHVQPGGNGNPFRNALYRTLVWLYLFRNYAVKSWAQFIEIFGIPFRVGKFPAGAGQSEKDALLDALAGMFGDSVVAIPDTTDIDLKDAKSGTGAEGTHRAFMDWSAKEISKVILGATLTSDSDGKGSYAMAKVHNDVRMDILEMDARAIANTINRDIIRPFVALNWGEQPDYPYLQFTLPEEAQREQTAKMLETLNKIGFTDIPVWWLHETFGIPTPEDGDTTLAAKPESEMPIKNAGMAECRNTGMPEFPHIGISAYRHPAISASRHTNISASRHSENDELDTMLTPIMNFIQSATSLDDIADRLYDLYPDMEINRFQQLIGRAMFAAGLWGAASQ